MISSSTEPAGQAGPLAWYFAAIRFLAGATMLTIVVIMTAQVITRYIFNGSLIWAEELCRYILIWQTFLFIGMAYSRGELVAVDLVPDLLTPKLRLALRAVMAVPILIFLWLMMVNGYVYSTRFAHQVVPAIDFIFMSLIGHGVGLSIFWVYVSVAVGSALLGLHIIASLIADFRALAAGRPKATAHPTVPQA
ncbi:TRAP-type C4-dicarboxylate transport system permease small subunit [Mesorhizobium sp. J18]|uniref:TRAP transporter small permease n=1 Tax=Mesorhizobium sp. J18 TaxID=935263 RepID=UPI00119946A1|nr:TRAP transporter small permease [Mesorhizobium sp. J18]TWG99517.1 TRAP-type C4-dicarboxylate transport system permease small subunit [Mesorhizobium sp. J18]